MPEVQADGRIQVHEVTSELIPAEGVPIERALIDAAHHAIHGCDPPDGCVDMLAMFAKLFGADRVELIDGRARITWFKEVHDA